MLRERCGIEQYASPLAAAIRRTAVLESRRPHRWRNNCHGLASISSRDWKYHMKRPANQQTEAVEFRAARNGLRALIVDDESLAREGIRMLLERDAEITLIEEAVNGKLAAELMLSYGFDLVFLDVQMPEMDGFAALRQAGLELSCAVIFVTAYDRYAVEAFEVNAADYLLKPFTPQRFRQALQRAKSRIRSGSRATEARVLAVLERIASQPAYL